MLIRRQDRSRFIFIFIMLTKGSLNPSRSKTESDMTNSCRFKFDFCVCFIFAFEIVTNSFQKNTHWTYTFGHLAIDDYLPSFRRENLHKLPMTIHFNVLYQPNLLATSPRDSISPGRDKLSVRLFVCLSAEYTWAHLHYCCPGAAAHSRPNKL